MLRVSERSRDIPSFLVMDVMAEADALQRAGEPVIHMEVGQPDRPTPPHIIEAGKEALRRNMTNYTETEGRSFLREAIADRYRLRYGVDLDPDRVLVTMGSSPTLFLIWGSLLEPGDEVIVTDPHYACYPGSVEFMGGKILRLPLDPKQGFRLDVERLKGMITPRTRAILINSPSNPTGMILDRKTLAELAAIENVAVVSDEIYHELEYEPPRCHSVLEFTQNAFVMDGFSKRYCMTGWRLGWLVVPEQFVRPVRKVHQNFFISAAEFVQYAGHAALTGPDNELVEMVARFDTRRRFLVEKLRELGFDLPAEPRGAFYVLADARKFGRDSVALARSILKETKVAVTPGVDFGRQAEGFLRFSYATSLDQIKEAMERLKDYCSKRT